MEDLLRGLATAHVGKRQGGKVREVEGSDPKSRVGIPRGLWVIDGRSWGCTLVRG